MTGVTGGQANVSWSWAWAPSGDFQFTAGSTAALTARGFLDWAHPREQERKAHFQGPVRN